ncbi:hypothetical protein DMB44_06010 [Thermoplasma sp. Kam2015]|uniref:gamma-glutamyltransferase family protein n=1 Tax=Thermoplasma sp. Kam2015 TaxID=2094122 RepID=UPI000D88FAF1|nr:gamma-glutamyltransferase family protein [Thermoplasma sp. Kam2015]PYB68053.1 hypothetical protein DMB44_06010 [Thermoplasma sp. Kam2015]
MKRSRPNAFSNKAVIASSSELASIAGRDVMKAGGNIFDAALAVSAALCVTQNNLCGLGGDLFALIRDENGEIIDLNGSGQSARAASIEFYESMGMSRIPERGIYAAITVPGIVGSWETIYRRYASLDIHEILKPAIRMAREGFPVTQNYSESITRSATLLGRYSGWSSIFMPGGRSPAPGEIFKQPDLANTLKSLAEDGYGSFYDGRLSETIAAGLIDAGSLIDDQDLKAYSPVLRRPVCTALDDFKIYETSPNSQGITVIHWVENLFQRGYGTESMADVKAIDLMESMYNAYEKRRYITDPTFMKNPNYKDSGIDSFARQENKDPDRGDTTYFSISDGEGRSVSMIQSNYMGFGSGIVPRGTGFVLQNRGTYFSLDKTHPNALMPGKRTFHTLAACIVEKRGDLYASFGSMGGDIQPQVQMQILMNVLRENSDPQAIIDRPRWAEPYTIYEDPGPIYVESTHLAEYLSEYSKTRGIRNKEVSPEFGTAQITTMLPNGVVVGAADPRGDGIAIPV